MFEQSILQGKTRKQWTIPLVILGELAIVGVLVLIPLLYVQTLPMADITSILTLPPPPPAPPPPPPPAAARAPRVQPRQFKMNVLTAPVTIPKEPVIAASSLPDAPSIADAGVPGGVVGGVPGGIAGGIPGGIIGSAPIVAAAPPPPPAPKAEPAPARLSVGGQVQAAKLIHEVDPSFPRLAHEARIGGLVRLKAVIAKDGTVKDLSVISGHPMLVPAALNAVKQWIYKPTFLNGTPIEVDTEVDVTFALST
jgi:protein TonB